MKMHEKYLEALKTFSSHVTISEWANKFVKMYPNENENDKDAIRKLIKNITSLVSTGKWSNMLLIDKSAKPQKVKYITNEPKEDNVHKNIYISKSTKDVKSINFKHLMKELENLPVDYCLPHRGDPKYSGDNEVKGIEQLDIYQFSSCMIFEMATRNKDVIEITNKLNYIEELKGKHPYLEHEECFLFKPIDSNLGNGLKIVDEDDTENTLPMLTAELEEEYVFIANLPISKFQDELDFLVDTEFSNNYNGDWYEAMINDGLDDPFKITEEVYKKHKFKKSTGITAIDNKSLTYGKLHIITEYLQDKLKNEYFIYPEGYYRGLERSCREEVISKDLIDESIFNSTETTDSINYAIKKFRTLKPTHLEQIADMFFMYDYYTKRRVDENLAFYAQDIKAELTKYHGIEIEGLKEKFHYDDCLDMYDGFKDLKANFYTVEKSITNKIEFMEEFIDKRLYRFILFL